MLKTLRYMYLCTGGGRYAWFHARAQTPRGMGETRNLVKTTQKGEDVLTNVGKVYNSFLLATPVA